MTTNEKINNLIMVLAEVEPELYSNKPCQYQILSKGYGLYSKKEADIICKFLRNGFHNELYNLKD